MKGLLALAVAGVLALGGFAKATENVALVIGNGTYSAAPEAETAVRDAKAVSEALRNAGWDVTLGLNLDRRAMKRTIRDFASLAAQARQITIFYSGHALRTGGISYLAPIDASADTLTDVLFDGVPLSLLLEIAGEAPGKAIVFVDGAQLRGFKPTEFVEPGLAALRGPEGVLIVSAAAPGRAVRRSRWRDSRFAGQIVDQFIQPGASVADVAAGAAAPTFAVGRIDAEFTLSPMPDPISAKELAAEIEMAYWRAAEQSGKAEDYRVYLGRYPNGLFADYARERLGLGADDIIKEQPPQVDPRILADRDLNLSRIRKRKLQEYLLALGFDPKGIDGLFGESSRDAIRRWQQRNGIRDMNGWLTQSQLSLLTRQGEAALTAQRQKAEREQRARDARDNAFWKTTGALRTAQGYRRYLERYPEGLHAKSARAALARIAESNKDNAAKRERKAFKRARARDTAEAYRDYLGAYPDGIYRDRALARLDKIENAERAKARRARMEAREATLGLTRSDRLSVEQRLRAMGYQPGPLDGVFDKQTRAAIKGYQQARGLRANGYLNQRTVVTLVRETRGLPAGEKGVVIDGAQIIREVLDALGKN